MQKIWIAAFLCCSLSAVSQEKVNVSIRDEKGEPVAATLHVRGEKSYSLTDSAGNAVLQFSSTGNYMLDVSAVGYVATLKKVSVPNSGILIIELEEDEHHLEPVFVQSTRTSRTIARTPTRVEMIEAEEIDEKINMRPANVAMLLHESTGILVQQTSPTSTNAGIRIQGLDGRYTQLLKDGYATFGNFSGGLSILEIPPLDLKQVEIIKGPASTLYGGGAIAGVVNFISKTPREEAEYNLLLNHSHIGQTNVGGFASAKHNRIGYTLLGLYSHAKAFDVDGDDFTEIPQTDEFTFHPKLFFYPNARTTISVGNSFSRAERTGGDIVAIRNEKSAEHAYTEFNETMRNTSTFQLEHSNKKGHEWLLKQSVALFNRDIEESGYRFSGKDLTVLTDLSYRFKKGRGEWVMGGNFFKNRFEEKGVPDSAKRNASVTTGGLFTQLTWDAGEKIQLEAGLRADWTNVSGQEMDEQDVFLLPRVSLLVRYNSALTSRIGGGLGYKTPTLFSEETERLLYKNVKRLSAVAPERSYGGTADINYASLIAPRLKLNVNHMFFYTSIEKPTLLEGNETDGYRIVNAQKPLISGGFETNMRLTYRENFKLLLGYTFTHIRRRYAVPQTMPLVPESKLNTALIYEKEGFLKLALEGFFTGKQHLENGQAPSFSEFGFLAEKIFRKFSLYINFENFTDTRQGKYKPVPSGPHHSPVFDEIWTHTEGFVMNGGIKLKF